MVVAFDATKGDPTLVIRKAPCQPGSGATCSGASEEIINETKPTRRPLTSGGSPGHPVALGGADPGHAIAKEISTETLTELHLGEGRRRTRCSYSTSFPKQGQRGYEEHFCRKKIQVILTC